jgi:hypothetical protein
MSTNQSLFSMLEDFGASLQNGMSKQASIGDSTPDGTQAVKEGARAAENEKDIKAKIVTNVNETGKAPNGTGGENTATNSIGTKKGETGEDVPSTKSTKDDPGTSSPAKAGPNGNGSGSEKSAAFNGDYSELSNDILAGIAVATHTHEKQASAQTAAPAAAPAAVASVSAVVDATPAGTEKKAGEVDGGGQGLTDEQIGYLHAHYSLSTLQGTEKQAAAAPEQNYQAELEKMARDNVAGILARAEHHAELTANYLAGWTKQAMGGMGGEVTDPAALMAGGAAPGAAMGGGDATGGGPAPMGDPAAGGGAPAGAPPMGGDPAAAMGGGAPAPGGAGGGDDMQAAVQLLQALQQAGISPQEVLQQLQGGGGGGGAPAPAPAGGGGGGDGPDIAAAAAAEQGSSDHHDAKGGSGGESKPKGDSEKVAAFKQLPPAMQKAAQAIMETALKGRAARRGK